MYSSQIAQREGFLWVPDDDIDLLGLEIDVDATDQEFADMIQVNKAAREWLNNQISLADYCDKLQLYGVKDPFEIVGEFCNHVELIMYRGM